ncbi:MAG: hypothetical protein HRU19_28455 [Pseudobacteriovorax sp.]|nr:hypothetical protein [Pseudobacteriovorax sp.]
MRGDKDFENQAWSQDAFTSGNRESSFSDPTNLAFQALHNHQKKSLKQGQVRKKTKAHFVPKKSVKKRWISAVDATKSLALGLFIGFVVFTGYQVLDTSFGSWGGWGSQSKAWEYIAPQTVSIRRGPSVDFEVVGNLPAGKLLRDVERVGHWIRLDYGRFIHISQIDALPKASLISRFTKAKPNRQRMLVYSAPHHLAPPLRELQRTGPIQVRRVGKNWLELESGGFIALRSQLRPNRIHDRLPVLSRQIPTNSRP